MLIHVCQFFFATCFTFLKKCTKIIYNLLNEKEAVPTAINKWRNELIPYGVDEVNDLMFLRFVLKQAMIFLFNCYSLEFYTVIFQWGIIFKKLSFDSCGFCTRKMLFSCDIPWSELSLYTSRNISERIGFR